MDFRQFIKITLISDMSTLEPRDGIRSSHPYITWHPNRTLTLWYRYRLLTLLVQILAYHGYISQHKIIVLLTYERFQIQNAITSYVLMVHL